MTRPDGPVRRYYVPAPPPMHLAPVPPPAPPRRRRRHAPWRVLPSDPPEVRVLKRIAMVLVLLCIVLAYIVLVAVLS